MVLEGKVAIVTCGSRGIGRAVVELFAKNGATVFFTYLRDEAAATDVSAAAGATAIKCSQTESDDIEKAVETVLGSHERIDILVNNAGITSDQFLMMMPFEQWEKVIDTNLNGAFRWAKTVSRPMLSAQSGAIVNIASVAGLVGVAGQTNYAASKGGLLAFTRALAAELGPKHIRVNSVVPGFIDTDMTAKVPRRVKRESMDRIVLKRFGTPEEVAQTVVFLASDAASYVVGQSIVVDGGLSSITV